MKTDGVFPEVLQIHLEKLRRHLSGEPEFLLEHDGDGWVPRGWNIFADLIGMDDQLETTWQLDEPTDRLLAPVRERATNWLSDPGPTWSTFRTATYLATNRYATLNIDMGLVRQWRLDLCCSDQARELATVCLIRYRRQPLTVQ